MTTTSAASSTASASNDSAVPSRSVAVSLVRAMNPALSSGSVALIDWNPALSPVWNTIECPAMSAINQA
jgi:hypothetical protein